jgi:hypothetical protein
MPIIDGRDVTPDHAIHQGLCPECGAALNPKSALSHAQGHWGTDPNSPRLSEEGRRRFNLILDFIEIAKPKPRPDTAVSSPPKANPQKMENDRLAEFLGFVFLEILAAPPAYDGWQAVKIGDLSKGLFFYGIAALPCVAGIIVLSGAWSRTRSKLSRWAAGRIYPVATDVRYWLALFLIVFVYLATPILLLQIKSALVEPTRTQEQTVTASVAAAPTPDTGPTPYKLSDQFASSLKHDFLSLPRPCVMKVTAPQQLQIVRSQIVGQAMNSFVSTVDGYGNWVIPACTIVDYQQDQRPELYGHSDFPAVGIVIHTSDKNLKVREFLAELFRGQSIPVAGDSTLPPGSPDAVIYIEIGHKLWE